MLGQAARLRGGRIATRRSVGTASGRTHARRRPAAPRSRAPRTPRVLADAPLDQQAARRLGERAIGREAVRRKVFDEVDAVVEQQR